MADAIEKHTGERPELIKGGGGIFDVKRDGEMIFSKHAVDRFPEHDELLSQIPARS